MSVQLRCRTSISISLARKASMPPAPLSASVGAYAGFTKTTLPAGTLSGRRMSVSMVAYSRQMAENGVAIASKT